MREGGTLGGGGAAGSEGGVVGGEMSIKVEHTWPFGGRGLEMGEGQGYRAPQRV